MSRGTNIGGTLVCGDTCPGGHLSGGQMSQHQVSKASLVRLGNIGLVFTALQTLKSWGRVPAVGRVVV